MSWELSKVEGENGIKFKEAQPTLIRKKKKRPKTRHIVIKIYKLKTKRTLKSGRKIWLGRYKGTLIGWSKDSLAKTTL